MELPEFPNYLIYPDGKVSSKTKVMTRSDGKVKTYKGKELIGFQDEHGYQVFDLYIDTKRIKLRGHRFVALAYIPNPDNLSCVNHIDGDRQNNSIDNLEWCTYAYNNQSVNRIGQCGDRKFGTIQKTPFGCFTAKYNSYLVRYQKNFKSLEAAEKFLADEEIKLVRTKFEKVI